MRAQIGIPYFYGGLAKLNWDWLHAQPLKIWLGNRASRPVMFHATNGVVFNIGIFPWVMAGATLIFFPPEWPRRLIHRLRAWLGSGARWAAHARRPGYVLVLVAVVNILLSLGHLVGQVRGTLSRHAAAPATARSPSTPTRARHRDVSRRRSGGRSLSGTAWSSR